MGEKSSLGVITGIVGRSLSRIPVTIGKAVAALTVAAVVSGCHTLPPRTLVGPLPPVPSYSLKQDGIAVRRVAILPLAYGSGIGRYLNELDTVFNAELNKTALFEIVKLSREDMTEIFGFDQISSVELIPADLLVRLQERYGVDAVMFTDITHYRPYQPIAIGVRAKLVEVQKGTILWAFDYVFDSGNPKIAEDAKRYYITNSRKEQAVGFESRGVLQSPARFAKYAASETYRSLVSQ